MSQERLKVKTVLQWTLTNLQVCGLWLSIFLLSVMLLSSVAFAQYQEPTEETQSAQKQPHAEGYHESALRRFEIVTLVSLPFTAIHSFLAVRGFEMVRQNEFAPELSSTDFKVIGASAVSLALFIGFWDWMHTHDKDPSQQLIPTSPKPTPPVREAEAIDWEDEESSGLVLPLVQVRF